MHYWRHIGWLGTLVSLDVFFLVSVSLVCDTLPVAGSVPAYVATLVLFLLRVYHYHDFAQTLIMYRRAHTDLPLPYSDLRPLGAAFWYSVLVVSLLLSALFNNVTALATSPRLVVVTVAWVLASAANAVTAWRIDDRHTLRRHIREALQRKQQHSEHAQRVVWDSASFETPPATESGDESSDDELISIELTRPRRLAKSHHSGTTEDIFDAYSDEQRADLECALYRVRT